MDIALVGLGRMGANMSRRLMRAGHRCFVFDVDSQKRGELQKEGAQALSNLSALKISLSSPRAVWLMLPAGEITDKTVQELAGILERGDIVINGGNSYFKDDVRHSKLLAERGIRFVDVGVSGGVWGLERGYSLMIGGDRDAAARLEPVFKTLAPGADPLVASPAEKRGSTAQNGYYYCGPAGAGHFVKMVHNGIEYGMMQAFAEGFDILRHANSPKLPADYRYNLNLREVSEVWRRGSVVASWLLDLIHDSLERDSDLSRFTGSVEDSGEGRWTVMTALEEAVPVPVISSSLYVRFRSREERSYAEQLLSAMRAEFGGHGEAKKEAS